MNGTSKVVRGKRKLPHRKRGVTILLMTISKVVIKTEVTGKSEIGVIAKTRITAIVKIFLQGVAGVTITMADPHHVWLEVGEETGETLGTGTTEIGIILKIGITTEEMTEEIEVVVVTVGVQEEGVVCTSFYTLLIVNSGPH